MTPLAPGPILFYDGACGLCDRSVQWALRRLRPASALRFAPLQGPTASALLPNALRTPPLRTVVFVAGPGAEPQTESRALRALASHVRAPWLAALWPPAADPVYRLVARWRHRVWGTSCALPTSTDRFLP